jgi:hypothetical protein
MLAPYFASPRAGTCGRSEFCKKRGIGKCSQRRHRDRTGETLCAQSKILSLGILPALRGFASKRIEFSAIRIEHTNGTRIVRLNLSDLTETSSLSIFRPYENQLINV